MVDGLSENFLALCSNSKGKSKQSGFPLHYLGNKIHRYNKDLGIIQGGDIQFGNGTGGKLHVRIILLINFCLHDSHSN